MRIIGIDPSVNNVGLAFYDTQSHALNTATFHPKRDKDTPIVNVAIQIARYITISFLQGRKRPDLAVMEYPQWEDSDRGRMAMQKGYIHNLAFVVGYLCSNIGLAGSCIYTPTPMQWKKNIPKKAIGIRFTRRFLVDYKTISDHEFEAAMMIDWLLAEGQKGTPPPSILGG